MPNLTNPAYDGYILLQDVQPSTNAGSASVSNAYQTRVLNTIAFDTLNLCTLASNQFTLKAGRTYQIDAKAPAYRINRHMLKLFNVTDNIVTLYGSGEYADTNNNVGNCSFLHGVFTLTKDTTFELQHFTEVAYLEGLGVGGKAAEGDTIIFTQVIIRTLY